MDYIFTETLDLSEIYSKFLSHDDYLRPWI